MNEESLRRLASAIVEIRGDRSQRELAELLEVAQSTVNSWENARNTPSLDNLEKLAKLRNELPEDFLAYLYGRSRNRPISINEIKAQIAVMSCPEIGEVSRAIADRLSGLQ